MPDKRSVTVSFQSWQEEGAQRSIMQGELYRLQTGWTLIYREPPLDANGTETINTLFIHERELRLRRRGTIFFEQSFRLGATLPGRMETPYGPHEVEALTSRLDIELSEFGGVIEWKYDLLMQDQAVGSFHIRLDIQEERTG